MNIGRSHIKQLLTEKGCRPYKVVDGVEIFVAEDGTIIRLPIQPTIHIDLVELIVLEQLDMGTWDYDYWLGQIGFIP